MSDFDNRTGGQLNHRTKKFSWQFLILGFLLLFLLSLVTVTQWLAYQWQFHASLGYSFLHVYPPWSALIWLSRWAVSYPDLTKQAYLLGGIVFAIGFLVFVFLIKQKYRQQNSDNYLHGSARWSNKKDITRSSLLVRDGVYVGAWVDKNAKIHYLRHNGAEHILTFAPTRSGKGVGLVVPTLLSWCHSAVVTDLKGELWALTSGWRKKYANNTVLRFEPSSSTDCVPWNPLDEIRIGTDNEVGDAQNIALLLVDQDGSGLKDHWANRAYALLTGLIIHLKYKALREGTLATLPEMDALLADPDSPLSELWDEMMDYPHLDGKPHKVAAQTGRDLSDTPEKEAGSIISTAKNALGLYRDPVVSKNVSQAGFHIRDLMHEDNPVTLYIVMPPSDKDRVRPLTRILISMIVRVLADKIDFEKGRPVANYKHRLLLLLDEFPSLGKLDIIAQSLAFIAGYGIKAYLITQDLEQLYAAYGTNESITSNCHIQNAYQPLNQKTATHLSKMVGTTTIRRKHYENSRWGSSKKFTWQFVQRPLLTDNEISTMPGPKKEGDKIVEAGDMLIFSAGMPAIYGRQPLYFQDPVFLARAAIDAPGKSDSFIEAQKITVNLSEGTSDVSP